MNRNHEAGVSYDLCNFSYILKVHHIPSDTSSPYTHINWAKRGVANLTNQYLGLFLLFLLHSQLYLCSSPFWVRFLHIWPFCNPTIEVVTFHLHGLCKLGVFVASIHPSRTWMSGPFESVRWNACVHRLDLSLYSHPNRVFGEWSQNPCKLQGKNPLYRKFRGRSNPQYCITQDSKPNILPTSVFRPGIFHFEVTGLSNVGHHIPKLNFTLLNWDINTNNLQTTKMS